VFAVEIPLFWKPTVRNELVATLEAAPEPLTIELEASIFTLKISAVDVTGELSPKKSQAAICPKEKQLNKSATISNLNFIKMNLVFLIFFNTIWDYKITSNPHNFNTFALLNY
jgi:hypothetical protein